MANNIEYKCPCCGAPLSFDAKTQNIVCDYCNTELDINDVKSYNEELFNSKPDNLDWSGQQYSEYSPEELAYLNVYHCDSCGGELICDDNTSATTCPYCGSNVILKGRLSGAYKPDFIIPFKNDKEQITASMNKFLKGKLFLPKVFKSENKINEIKAMYAPYWLYTADADGKVTFKGEKRRSWVSGDYRYDEVKYYSLVRGGRIGFDNIPVDGSRMLPDALMESIEPFYFGDAKPFETAYLSGYLSDKYDVDQDECYQRATTRIVEGTIDAFRKTISGYSSVSYSHSNLSLEDKTVKYALYPVWLLNSTWKNKKFSFAMNGETGKMSGNLPLSKGKYFFWFMFWLIITFVIMAGIYIANVKGFENAEPAILVVLGLLGFITPSVFCGINRRKLKPVKLQRGAKSYYREGSFYLRESRDIYLYKHVSRTKINRDNKR